MEVAALSPALAREMVDAFRELKRLGLLASTRGDQSSMFSHTPIYVRNQSTETIPPFACMQAMNTEENGSQNYILVNKPSENHGGLRYFLWNGPKEIEASGFGKATDGPIARMLIKPAEPTTNGLRFAPTVGQWYMSEDPLGIALSAGPDDIGTQIIRANIDGGVEACVVYTQGATARSGSTAGFGTGTVQKLTSGAWSNWTSQAGSVRTVTYYTVRSFALGAGYVTLVRGQKGGEWYEANQSTNLDCNDPNRAITDIWFDLPTLYYRKGTNCNPVEILTGTTCDGPTAAPSGLASTGTTTTSVSLSWTDNSSNEDGFVVQYKASSSGTWLTFETTAANATTSTVTGLTAGTSYDFRVAAVNVYGQSSYDTETGISTAAEP